MPLYAHTHATLSSYCNRQWDEEEKARQQKTVTPAEQSSLDLENDDDSVSTVGGVLHEENFTETKAWPGAGAGRYDVEAPQGSSQEEQGLLAVFKIVDWWKVRSRRTLLLLVCALCQPGFYACHTGQQVTGAVWAAPAIAMSHNSVNHACK